MSRSAPEPTRRLRWVVWTALGLAAALVAWGGRRELQFAWGARDDSTCIGCHTGQHPGLVSDWHGSAHFRAGVGCADCHGEQHEAIIIARGAVATTVCATCHAKATAEFSASVHGRAWDAVEGAGLFLGAPEALRDAACRPCHEIGRPGAPEARGRCESCHGGHRYDAALARQPEACAACHDGPDRPEYTAWSGSAHGLRWRQTRDASAPTCATCHLGGETGHADLGILTLGQGRQGAVLEGEPATPPQTRISRADFESRRAQTVALCRRCHAQDKAERSLALADAVKREADRPLAESAELVRRLFADGHLRPMPQDRRPDPVTGHALALGESYTETSLVEQRYFELARIAHPAAVRGAYHFAPSVLHWQGWMPLQAGLTQIRDEARRLRAQAGPAIAPTLRQPGQ